MAATAREAGHRPRPRELRRRLRARAGVAPRDGLPRRGIRDLRARAAGGFRLRRPPLPREQPLAARALGREHLGDPRPLRADGAQRRELVAGAAPDPRGRVAALRARDARAPRAERRAARAGLVAARAAPAAPRGPAPRGRPRRSLLPGAPGERRGGGLDLAAEEQLLARPLARGPPRLAAPAARRRAALRGGAPRQGDGGLRAAGRAAPRVVGDRARALALRAGRRRPSRRLLSGGAPRPPAQRRGGGDAARDAARARAHRRRARPALPGDGGELL